MNTAKLKYRDYVSSGWIAIKFCSLDFMGENKEEYKNMWHKIEYENIDEKEKEIEKLKKEIVLIKKEYDKVNIFWRIISKFWKNRSKSGIVNKLVKNEREKKKRLEQLEKNKYKDVFTLKREAWELLEKLNFVQVNQSTEGDGAAITTEIYHQVK